MNVLTPYIFRKLTDEIQPDYSLKWGVRDLNSESHVNNAPVTERLLIDLTTNHLENILITQTHLTPTYKKTIIEIIKLRQRS